MQDLSKAQQTLGINFKNEDLLKQSLTHRSYLNENRKVGWPHNERLEFLGDAVIELVVTDYLFKNYNNPEGELTSWRAALVNSKTLSLIAQKIKLDDFLLLSRGEAKDKGKARQYILANAFEAVVGAIYIDQGLDVCRKFLQKILLPLLRNIIEKKLYQDPKSLFQEEAQDRVGITPTYEVVKEWGLAHERKFSIAVFLGSEKVAEGSGSSKQEAQEKAATKALKVKQWGG